MYGKSRFLTTFALLGYIGPFAPLPIFFGRTNHTNLTRRIDPRHPEPPNSSIPPKMAFSFFRFLGLGAERSVFWVSGQRSPFSGLQGRERVRFLDFREGWGSGGRDLPATSGDWPGAGGMHQPATGECQERTCCKQRLEQMTLQGEIKEMTAAQGTPNRGNKGKSVNLIKFDQFFIFHQNRVGAF